ncbi:MAG: hypothetical protein AB8G11_12270 [Saprospiraceae bacterium]
MFYQLFIILQMLFYPPSPDNFEGIIKYNVPNTTDSLIYYIRSDKIRIHRKGNFVTKYGNYTDELFDLENNRTALYNIEKGEYEFFDNNRTYFPPQKINEKWTILNHSCEGYEIDYGKVGFESRMQDKIYVADSLYFEIPENCIIQTPMITNGTGKIALKQVRTVESQHSFSESVFEAVKIIPMEIPDSLLLLQ